MIKAPIKTIYHPDFTLFDINKYAQRPRRVAKLLDVPEAMAVRALLEEDQEDDKESKVSSPSLTPTKVDTLKTEED